MRTLLDQLNGNALYALSQMVRHSCRFQVAGLDNLEQAQKSQKPLIFTAWHGMTMMLVGFLGRRLNPRNFVMLMPDDWRGGALSVFARKWGAEPIPMDLTAVGGMATARKLAHMIQLIKKGFNCYITPDGPHGPAYVIKPGVVFVAQKTGGLIVPLGAYARHAYRQNRWDQYAVPFPFSRVSVEVGAPIAVEKGIEISAVSEHLTNVLHRVTAQAAANYYEWGANV